MKGIVFTYLSTLGHPFPGGNTCRKAWRRPFPWDESRSRPGAGYRSSSPSIYSQLKEKILETKCLFFFKISCTLYCLDATNEVFTQYKWQDTYDTSYNHTWQHYLFGGHPWGGQGVERWHWWCIWCHKGWGSRASVSPGTQSHSQVNPGQLSRIERKNES